MYEKKILERWLKQLQSGELNPDAIGLGSNRDKAIEKVRGELTKIRSEKSAPGIKP